MAPRWEKGMERPWGWWLTAGRDGLVDEEGRTWRTVRDAFWQGRLGFPQTNVAQEQAELLLRVLNAKDRRFVGEAEGKHDLFDGDMMFWRFYMCWLVSIGLTEAGAGGASAYEAGLTDEGRAVMLMLQSTRDPGWSDLPMRDVVEAVRTARREGVDAAREQELKAFEAEAVHLPWIFGRRRVGASFLITLTGIAVDSRMPTRRVVWTQAFSDEVMRDDFFAWMAERVERWEDWGKLAYRQGADALTQRLLALVGVSPSEAS